MLAEKELITLEPLGKLRCTSKSQSNPAAAIQLASGMLLLQVLSLLL